MRTNLNLEIWLTTKEACQLVDRTRPTINTWVAEGLVETQYIGEKPLFNKKDLLEAKTKKEKNSRRE